MDRGAQQTFFQRRHTNGQQAHEKIYNITDHGGNTNQNHNELSHHTSKRQQTTSVGEDVKKGEPQYTFGENVNCCSHSGKQYGGSLKN